MNYKGIYIVLFLFFSLASPVFANVLPDQAAQQISDFSLVGYEEKGKKSWDISGRSADIFTEVVKLKDVNGNLYGKDEDVNLTAKKGDFNKEDGKVSLREDVVITTSGGAKLTTDSMDWDRKNQVVTTKDRVNIDKDNINIVGIGAYGEPGLNKMALNKDIRVDINPLSPEDSLDDIVLKDRVVITCDGSMEVDYGKNIASFNINVRVERPDIIIYSDKMDIYFTAGDNSAKSIKTTESMAGSIDRIVASGNVRIVRGDNVSYSQEAVYTAQDKRIVLNGRPRLVFYSTEEFKNASFGN
ncbi:MAG: LPS export ABC transporter periplasmic protein LptC [Candidatus Omnitrophica bacterium]|jgi:LPS export ABC transporter protein LptC|nr:LPS export ABC transporter periplasmic protein LptC [Candidatus Omnitrophota bacterium]MDD3987462.1 LPS export ABC transporter periplasmic protein LptC [Candidatus Omnitrophota bacterium]MDD5664677.1 LPS export ABC transporter periplasmic protein LptC [Candidatus Omnitrophota bacterium]